MTVAETLRSSMTRLNRPIIGHQLPLWIEIWFGVSALICTLDVMYTMLRPLTNRGGPLECVYEPWNWYADVDVRYATPSDIVTMATGRVMIIEIVMNLVSMFLNRSGSKHTLITAFTTNSMVLWKTIWYMVLYIRVPEGNPEYINPNASIFQIIFCFIIPNCVWIAVPSAVMVRLWQDLTIYPSRLLPEYYENETEFQGNFYYTKAPKAEDESSGTNLAA